MRERNRIVGTRFAACALALAASIGLGSAQEVTRVPLPTVGMAPGNLVTVPDGNLWFMEVSASASGEFTAAALARITPDGVITEIPIPAASAGGPLTLGPDGNFWFVESLQNRIARVSMAGQLTEFAVPTAKSAPSSIVAGADGNLWFVEQDADKIGRITPDGAVIVEFPIPTAVSLPWGIAKGPDGNVWFTEQSGNNVGRITPAGVITEFAIPTVASIPHGIVAGPDGNLWFSEGQGGKIGRISRYGQITEFPVISAYLGEAIAAGPDGNLWFTTNSFDTPIGSITTAGAATLFPTGSQFVLAGDIASGPDGRVWFTESPPDVTQAWQIARITTGPCTANATTLCLDGGRFSARATWEIPGKGLNGQAGVMPISDTAGWFWFFDPSNPEMMVKVLDGCKIDGHEWVFAGGLTNVETTLTVVDIDAGGVKTYRSPAGTAFQSIQDTKAFAACPPSP
jgi:streptogramin lyase